MQGKVDSLHALFGEMIVHILLSFFAGIPTGTLGQRQRDEVR